MSSVFTGVPWTVGWTCYCWAYKTPCFALWTSRFVMAMVYRPLPSITQELEFTPREPGHHPAVTQDKHYNHMKGVRGTPEWILRPAYFLPGWSSSGSFSSTIEHEGARAEPIKKPPGWTTLGRHRLVSSLRWPPQQFKSLEVRCRSAP